MPTFVNSDVHRRVWLGLQDHTGATVELGPGETVELDLAEDSPALSDPYLKPVAGRRAHKSVPDPEPAPVQTPEPAKE